MKFLKVVNKAIILKVKRKSNQSAMFKFFINKINCYTNQLLQAIT